MPSNVAVRVALREKGGPPGQYASDCPWLHGPAHQVESVAEEHATLRLVSLRQADQLSRQTVEDLVANKVVCGQWCEWMPCVR